jgi:hypothetical protein
MEIFGYGMGAWNCTKDPLTPATLIVVRSSSSRAEAHKKPLAICCRPSSFSLQITIH